jgi:hypothetical protein
MLDARAPRTHATEKKVFGIDQYNKPFDVVRDYFIIVLDTSIGNAMYWTTIFISIERPTKVWTT